MVDEGGGGEVVQNPVIVTMPQRAKGRQAPPCIVSLAMLATPRHATPPALPPTPLQLISKPTDRPTDRPNC